MIATTLVREKSYLRKFRSTAQSGNNPTIFNYVSDGDANGICYYFGTNFGANAWTNPHTAGFLSVNAVVFSGSGSVATLVDRTTSNYSTNGTGGAGNEWFYIDFGSGRSVNPSKFSYRWRNDTNTFSPTAWTWEGSNDNSSWTTLATVTGQTPVAGNWVSTTPSVTGTFYRYIRFKQTGNNNSGTSHVSGNELEVYGTLIK